MRVVLDNGKCIFHFSFVKSISEIKNSNLLKIRKCKTQNRFIKINVCRQIKNQNIKSKSSENINSGPTPNKNGRLPPSRPPLFDPVLVTPFTSVAPRLGIASTDHSLCSKRRSHVKGGGDGVWIAVIWSALKMREIGEMNTADVPPFDPSLSPLCLLAPNHELWPRPHRHRRCWGAWKLVLCSQDGKGGSRSERSSRLKWPIWHPKCRQKSSKQEGI